MLSLLTSVWEELGRCWQVLGQWLALSPPLRTAPGTSGNPAHPLPLHGASSKVGRPPTWRQWASGPGALQTGTEGQDVCLELLVAHHHLEKPPGGRPGARNVCLAGFGRPRVKVGGLLTRGGATLTPQGAGGGNWSSWRELDTAPPPDSCGKLMASRSSPEGSGP